MTLHVYEVKHSVLQSHPPHFKCSVASLWSGAMVLYRADLKKVPSSQRILLDISLQITEGLQREHLPQGSFACVVLIHRYLCIFFFFASFYWNRGFENLVPFKLSTVGTIWLGSTKNRAEGHNTMRTPVWTELAIGMKNKLHGALVAPWGRACDLSPGLELNHPRTVLPRKMSGLLEVKTCWGFCVATVREHIPHCCVIYLNVQSFHNICKSGHYLGCHMALCQL